MCAPVSKAMKLMREDKLEMEGNKQHMGAEIEGKMTHKQAQEPRGQNVLT